MILTAEETLERMIGGWTKLSKSGAFTKDGIPEFEGMAFKCPLCEYRNQQGKSCRDGCLLFGKWDSINGYCILGNGYFDRWDGSLTIDDRKYWAEKIADIADEELQQLRKGIAMSPKNI